MKISSRSLPLPLPLLLLLLPLPLFAQNALPIIANVEVVQGPGDQLTLSYDLEDAENDPCTLTFRATEKGGLTFDFNTANATGDVGPGILPGTGKSITWDYSSLGLPGAEFRLMLVADDGQPVDIQSVVDQVDSAALLANLTFLEGVRHRTSGAAHLAEVQEYLRFQFLYRGLETTVQEWQFNNYTGQNFIGRHIGTSEEETVYIIDGHYDSVAGSPGADDNASAVAGMLEALRVLAPYGFKKSIRFIGFDLEEAGLRGSIEYVQNGIAPAETTAGVFNFEMIGYYTEAQNSQSVPFGFGLLYPDQLDILEANGFRGDFITVVGDGGSAALISDYENAAANYVPALKIISLQAPNNWQTIIPDLGRSDHAPFWAANIPALMLTDGAENRNSNYHTPNDVSSTLNFTFMRHVTQATVAALAELAEIQHATTWWGDTPFLTPTTELAGCDFKISPNPARNLLRVQWPACQPGDLQVDLLDLSGRTVRQYAYRAHSGQDFQLVDVRGLEPGVYFLRLQNAAGQWVERVVVD